MNKSIFNGPLCGTWQKTASLILQTGLRKPEGFAESHRKNMAQTAKEQMSLYYQFFTSTSCSQTFTLQGTLFSGFCIALLTAEPGYLLPPHCVNDIHWCNIVFPWKGKLIIGSYRAYDDPMPGNWNALVECRMYSGWYIGKGLCVENDASGTGNTFSSSPTITKCYQVVSSWSWTCYSSLLCLSPSVNWAE